MNNREAAIYQMLNELAKRHGLRPIDFYAEFKEYEPESCFCVEFEPPANITGPEFTKYQVLLMNLGIYPDQQHRLVGNTDKIFAALEYALQVVPEKSSPVRGR